MGLDHELWIRKKSSKSNDDFKPLAIWRKNNAIHNYVCTHIAHKTDINLQNIPLKKKDLQKLYDTTLKVLDKRNLETSIKLLPTVKGFFFGSTEYMDFYYEQIKTASDDIHKVLTETDFKNNNVYYHSWY